ISARNRKFESTSLQRRVTREPVYRSVGNLRLFQTGRAVVHLFADSYDLSAGGQSIVASPFSGEGNAVYFAAYNANKARRTIQRGSPVRCRPLRVARPADRPGSRHPEW